MHPQMERPLLHLPLAAISPLRSLRPPFLSELPARHIRRPNALQDLRASSIARQRPDLLRAKRRGTGERRAYSDRNNSGARPALAAWIAFESRRDSNRDRF